MKYAAFRSWIIELSVKYLIILFSGYMDVRP